VEQTLEAKLGLLQTKLDNARDPKNKTQRKIYVGNIIPSINGDFLKQLFTQTLLISYPQWNIPGQECVVEAQYRDGNKYCFLEFCSMEMASAALQVNGVTVMGSQLQVSRPTGFLDTVECERAVKEAERELIRFRTGEDETPLLRQPGYPDLVNKIRGSSVHGFKHTDKDLLSVEEKTPYLAFNGIVTESALDSTEEVQELYQDIQEKVSEFGDLTRMIIPRPPVGLKGSDMIGKGQFGKAFVQFSSEAVALSVRNAIDGMIFDGRVVNVRSIPEKEFLTALGL
jgi:RNA recognition motif-containing protein